MRGFFRLFLIPIKSILPLAQLPHLCYNNSRRFACDPPYHRKGHSSKVEQWSPKPSMWVRFLLPLSSTRELPSRVFKLHTPMPDGAVFTSIFIFTFIFIFYTGKMTKGTDDS